MRRTKIVATLGPSSSSDSMIRRLLKEGVDVFRLNFSHGKREEHRALIRRIRALSEKARTPVAILQDLCGPKIRAGIMQNDAVALTDGSVVTITTRPCTGTAECFSTSYKALPKDITRGARILLDDGRLELRVLAIKGEEVRCEVVHGGVLKNRKGINLPGTNISSPSVTTKDMQDLQVGLEEGVDFVALSFVRHPDDIRKVRRAVKRAGATAQIVAKIEKPEAIQHIDAILQETDGIMVARGDLGVEMDVAQVPLLQKDLIHRANLADKYVITATQMLESMIDAPFPTRAEVSDVANAILDGTDAVMLSGETAAGKYPAEAVQMMDRIARQTEAFCAQHPPAWDWSLLNPHHPLQDAIGHATLQLAKDLEVRAIAAFSATGGTGLFLSKSRPFSPIIVFTHDPVAYRRMRLFWGITPVLDGALKNKQELLQNAKTYIRKHGIAGANDHILLVAGSQFGQVGSTNGIEIASLK